MYTHQIVKSKQKCFYACSYPTKDKNIQTLDNSHPMMMLESGQVTRVSSKNLRKIKKQYTETVIKS